MCVSKEVSGITLTNLTLLATVISRQSSPFPRSLLCVVTVLAVLPQNIFQYRIN